MTKKQIIGILQDMRPAHSSNKNKELNDAFITMLEQAQTHAIVRPVISN